MLLFGESVHSRDTFGLSRARWDTPSYGNTLSDLAWVDQRYSLSLSLSISHGGLLLSALSCPTWH